MFSCSSSFLPQSWFTELAEFMRNWECLTSKKFWGLWYYDAFLLNWQKLRVCYSTPNTATSNVVIKFTTEFLLQATSIKASWKAIFSCYLTVHRVFVWNFRVWVPNVNIVQLGPRLVWVAIYWFKSEILPNSIIFFPKSGGAKWHALKKWWCHCTHDTHANDVPDYYIAMSKSGKKS